MYVLELLEYSEYVLYYIHARGRRRRFDGRGSWPAGCLECPSSGALASFFSRAAWWVFPQFSRFRVQHPCEASCRTHARVALITPSSRALPIFLHRPRNFSSQP